MADIFLSYARVDPGLLSVLRDEGALTDFYESFPQAAECTFVTGDDFVACFEVAIADAAVIRGNPRTRA